MAEPTLSSTGVRKDGDLTARELRRNKTVTEADATPHVHFESDIKPLFRARDEQAMKWFMDLYSYQDVSEHAAAILARLRNGSMPCDGRWPDDRIDLFDRWIRDGKLP
jgi:hypothetical protein